MSLQKVIDKVRRSILHKSILLETYNNDAIAPYPEDVIVVIKHYLTTEIKELEELLQDLEDLRK